VLERIAAGDPAAVDECLDQYGGLVWSLVRRQLRQHDDAEDAVQEIFVDLWRSAARFDPAVASEATFVTMIARRRLIDRRRKRSRAGAPDSLTEDPAGPVLSERHSVDVAEEARQAREAMQALRPEERLVLELALLEGRTHREIAEAANMPLGTVKTHARRGLLRLRALLGVEGETTIRESIG
jgi:RNA polymerase sigma-70 factor (ECF subfamily)